MESFRLSSDPEMHIPPWYWFSYIPFGKGLKSDILSLLVREDAMGIRRASKYEGVIELKWTRARRPWDCYSCGHVINPGDYYYRQSLGLIRKPPDVPLHPFCSDCNHSPQAKMLHKIRGNPARDGYDEAIHPQQSLFSMEKFQASGPDFNQNSL